ncbi:MAG TPA: type III secretion system domain-containing protein [Trinickia sp.]|jgi:hypothetical protein|nr:type III secretion system domain-containing protein [Trinickia sp.]
MSAAPIDPALQRLHQLAWRPGAWMHETWWVRLDLEPWRRSYLNRPACRASLDRLIVARRSFPSRPLPGSLEADERLLVELEPRFPSLVTALGVIALACVDHLMLKPHREALAPHLGISACDQLLALHDGWDLHAIRLSPDVLAEAALSAGAHWWRRDANRSIAGRLLATLLPPDVEASAAPYGSAVEWIVKLARFL